MRLTARRLAVIVEALAYMETNYDDGYMSEEEGPNEAEWKRKKQLCQEAFVWAHEQLAKRGKTVEEVA